MQLPTNFDVKKALSIGGALSISALMIFASYFFSGPNIFTTQRANAEDTKKLLEAYAVKDSDGDGLPDWQEALYATNPQDAHSVDKTLTDKQAVEKGLVKPKFESAPIATSTVDIASLPGVSASSTTLTDQFARQLFTQYIQGATKTQPTPDQVASFVTGAVGQLNGMYVAPVSYTLSDVKIQGTGPDALRTYIVSAGNTFFAHVPADPKDETSYFYDAVTKNDETAIKEVAKIGAWYTATGKAFVKVPVPSEAAAAHLRISNALIQIGSVVTDMSLINSDPLRTLIAVGHYDDAKKEMLDSLTSLNAVFTSNAIVVESEAPGARFFQTVRAWSLLNQ